VVDVTHDRDDRRTLLEALVLLALVDTLGGREAIFLADRDVFDVPPELVGDDLGGLGIQVAVDVDPGIPRLISFINTSPALAPILPASVCRPTLSSILTIFFCAERSCVTGAPPVRRGASDPMPR
jgi:hypothetical protein